GRLHDLGDDQLPRPGVVRLARRDQHVALDPAVVRLDVADPGLDDVAPDQAGEPALQHLDDHTLAAAAPVHAGDAGQRAVAVQDLAHLERRQEQVVALAAFRAQEAEAVRVGDDGAGDQVGALGGDEAAAPVLQQLAVAQHRREALVQRVEALRLQQAQLVGQGLRLHRAVVRGEDLQDHLAAGDRVLVAPGLALGVRITRRGPPRPTLATGFLLRRWRFRHPTRQRLALPALPGVLFHRRDGTPGPCRPRGRSGADADARVLVRVAVGVHHHEALAVAVEGDRLRRQEHRPADELQGPAEYRHGVEGGELGVGQPRAQLRLAGRTAGP